MRYFVFLLLVACAACTVAPEREVQRKSPPSFRATSDDNADLLDACFRELHAVELTTRDSIERSYRLSREDAEDLVRDAMLSVCVRHVERRYTWPTAALQRAAANRARDDWRHRRRYPRCPVDETQEPRCDAWADENTRFDQEQSLVESALCKEDRVTERIIRLRVLEQMRFAEIGREVGLAEHIARSRYNQAIARVRKRLGDACGL